MSGCGSGSGCERCASNDKAVRDVYKGLSDAEILSRQVPAERAKVGQGDPRRTGLVEHTGVAGCADLGRGDRRNQIAALSARIGSAQLGAPPNTLDQGDFITSNNGCCNTATAREINTLAPYAAPLAAQSFSWSMVGSIAMYTGCPVPA